MVLGKRGLGMLFLAVAGVLFCLLVLSATSSGAQTRTEPQAGGTTDATSNDNCVEFEDTNTGTGTSEEGAGTNTGGDTTNTGENTGTQQAQQNGQQTQSQNENNAAQQNGGTGGQQTSQNGDTSAQQTQQNGTTSPDAGTGGNNECVIADTVPGKLLPPTGAPVKSGAEKTASEKQKKTDSGKKPESSTEKQKKSNSGGKKLEIKDRGKKIEIEDRSGKEPRQERLKSRSKSASTSDLAPVLAANWPRPTNTEVASVNKPRRFAPGPGSEMTLSARTLGIYDAPIASSGRPEDLDNGLIRVPETSLPWDKGNQKNVYVAGHYLGNSGTASRLVFYNLHKLRKGDEIVLKDGLGQPYKYRVSEKFAAGPEDSWAMGQVRNRDMVTLQTCIPPDFGKRLIVRADRVR